MSDISKIESADVVIIGAGPVGMFCTLELLPYGVSVVVLETRTEPDTRLRARVLQSQTLSILERRGLLDEIQPAEKRTVVHYGGFEKVRTSEIRADHRYSLFARQQSLEAVLAKRLSETDCSPRWGHTVTEVAADTTEPVVTVRADDTTYQIRARYVLACDGGRSRTRRALGIDFAGLPPTLAGFQAMATITSSADLSDGWHRTDQGMYVMGPGRRMALIDYGGDTTRSPEGEELAAEYAEALRRVIGPDTVATDVESLTRFSDNSRLASQYRKGSVFLVGDAAHVHPPFGAQGLNLGIQDAANLTWKLGAVLTGVAPESLLDTYERERRPAAQNVIDLALSQSALMRPDPQTTALRIIFDRLLDDPVTNRAIAEMMAGVNLRYPAVGCSSTGRYARDLPVVDASGQESTLARLQLAHPTCHIVVQGVDCDGTEAGEAPLPVTPLRARVAGAATSDRAHWVRPDGYVAACLAA
jgi:2-polyprenyl-6-methoxyphenol hydroxylase-like FAD-dependent oxidoreductase